MPISSLPAFNAALNTMSALLLILGYTMIRQRAITAHTLCMVGAFITSTIFLVSYLYYHAHHGATRFPGTGGIRIVYFTILITHTILAVVQVPLILTTLFTALKSKFTRHVRVARITLPIWLYVSVTGVVVYWMLYRVEY
jgi:uncharacterized membrane protein YozB (DUF420 family)